MTKLTAAQAKILNTLEDNTDRRPGLSVQELGYYKSEFYCGVGEQSCRSNLQKMEKLGLVRKLKVGRSTYYRRTSAARPESAEEYKDRIKAEKDAELRRLGKIATCQGCLRSICLQDSEDTDKRHMARHGWAFVSQTGRYGWHEGQCLGTAHSPLEDDYKIALSCMMQIVETIKLRISIMSTLLSRPDTISTTESKWDEATRRHINVLVPHDRDDRDMDKACPSYYNTYENALRRRVVEERRHLKSLASDLEAFYKAVSAIWDNADTAETFASTDPVFTHAKVIASATGFDWA